MIRITAVIIVGFFSCKQQTSTGNISLLKDTVLFEKMADGIESDGPAYSLDEMYQQYLNEELHEFLKKEHPIWSVPNKNKWYPGLFQKYKTEYSLVNYNSRF